MKRYLRYDTEARELRLVLTDLWDGMHEHSEYRIPNTVRSQDFDDRAVWWDPALARYYVQLGDTWSGHRTYLAPEERPVVSTKTQCPRMASKSGRAKCQTCRELGWQEAPKRAVRP